MLYVQDYVTKSCELLDLKYKELDEDYIIVYEIAKKRKKQIEMLKGDMKRKNKVIEMYELMIQKSNDDQDALLYTCIYSGEKFRSLELLKQHHYQFYRDKEFDESLYTKNAHHKNAKERKELEKRMLEEQRKREEIREKELKVLQSDLKALRKDLSQVMKSEITGIVKDKDENLKIIDKKLIEMKSMVTNSLAHKDDHKKWVETHDEMQETKLSDLKTHIDTTLVKYKEDLDTKLKTINAEKDKVKEDLQAEISGKDNELSIHRKKIDQLKRELAKAQDTLEDKSKELKEANSILGKTQTERDSSSRNKQIAEDRIALLEKHKDGLTEENKKLKSKISDLEKDLEKAQKQLNTTGEEKNTMIQSLNRELKERDSTSEMLTKEMNKLKSDKKSLTDKIDDLEKENTDLKNTIDKKKFLSEKDTQKEIREYKNKYQQLEQKVGKMEDEKKELETEVVNLKKQELKPQPQPQTKEKSLADKWKHTKLSQILRRYRDVKGRGGKDGGMGHRIRKRKPSERHTVTDDDTVTNVGSLNLKRLVMLMENKHHSHENLGHKYRDAIKTKFLHTLTDFESSEKGVRKDSAKFEANILKTLLQTNGSVMSEDLPEPQLKNALEKFQTKYRNLKDDLSDIQENVQNKTEELRPQKEIDKSRTEILKDEAKKEKARKAEKEKKAKEAKEAKERNQEEAKEQSLPKEKKIKKSQNHKLVI